MLNRTESLCLFLVSVSLFSLLYSASFSEIGRVIDIYRAYAQPIMGIQQQQKQSPISTNVISTSTGSLTNTKKVQQSDIPNNADGQIEGKAVASSTETVGSVRDHWSSSLEFLTALARDQSDFHLFRATSPIGATIGTCDVKRDSENLNTGEQYHTEKNYSVVIGTSNTLVVDGGGQVQLLGDGTAIGGFSVGPDYTHCVGNLATIRPALIKVQSNGDFTFNANNSYSNSGGNYQDNWDVIIHPINQPPIASSDISNTFLTPGEHAKLFGTASDPENGPLTYSWTQGGGTPVQWSTAQNILQPEFVIPPFDKNNDFNNHLLFTFLVTDDHGNQAAATISAQVIPINHPPVAVVQILPSDVVNPGTIVTLNASKSNDPDPEDHIKSFFWEQTVGPAVTLNSTSSPIIHFTAPSDIVQNTTLKFNLTLIDSNFAPSISVNPVTINIKPSIPTCSAELSHKSISKSTASPTLCTTLSISLKPEELDPSKTNPLSTVTVTATTSSGVPVQGLVIHVSTCTQKGGAPTPSIAIPDNDGHTHDTLDANNCSTRPDATLGTGSATTFVGNTNNKGVISVIYKPPKGTDTKPRYISGTDKIIAEAKLSENPALLSTDIKADKNIITRVSGLQVMPDSEVDPSLCGAPGSTYGGRTQTFPVTPQHPHEETFQTFIFEVNSHHNCMYYGTDSVNNAIISLARAFVDRQINCRDHPTSNACSVTDDHLHFPQINTINLPLLCNNGNHPNPSGHCADMSTPHAKILPIKITAMNLPWGGLYDVNGKWNSAAGHTSHNNGKQVDIGFGNLDLSHELLLRQVIKDAHLVFGSIQHCEGDINISVPAPACLVLGFLHAQTDHIHLNF